MGSFHLIIHHLSLINLVVFENRKKSTKYQHTLSELVSPHRLTEMQATASGCSVAHSPASELELFTENGAIQIGAKHL